MQAADAARRKRPFAADLRRFDGCPGIRLREFVQESALGLRGSYLLFCFGDLVRGVCSSIDHLRSRIREPEGGSAPASVKSDKRFDGFPGFRPGFRENGDLMGVPESVPESEMKSLRDLMGVPESLRDLMGVPESIVGKWRV